LKNLLVQRSREELHHIKEEECRNCPGCDACGWNPTVTVAECLPSHLGVIPDAFSIVKTDRRFGDEWDHGIATDNPKPGDFCLTKALEVDGSSDLNSKLDSWIDFGEWVDSADDLFPQLTIVSLHGHAIGKYTEANFWHMWVNRTRRELARSPN
jgi:hypothetical protein